MSLQNLIMQIKSSREILTNAKAAAAGLLNEMMKDESIPLWDRWNLFMEYSSQCFDIGSDTSCVKRDVVVYCRERYGTPRYQTIWFDGRFDEDFLTENQRRQYPDIIEDCKKSFEEIPENIVRGIIASGYAGFVNDW